MVCTGAKSEEESRLAARKYARIIQKLGFPTKFKDFKIQNMVDITFDNLTLEIWKIVLQSLYELICWKLLFSPGWEL